MDYQKLQVQKIVFENPRLIQGKTADTKGIKNDRVLHIFHKELHIEKLFGKLMPHSLIIQQKLKRKQISQHHRIFSMRIKPTLSSVLWMEIESTNLISNENKNDYGGLRLVLSFQHRWSQKDRPKMVMAWVFFDAK